MQRRDKGATAVVVAISMLVIMGFAALVVDLGAGFNERAQDQSAADTAALAGAGNPLSGVSGIRDAALAYVEDNLDTAYLPGDWHGLWESCTDPDKGAAFQPVPSPWSAANLDCISIDPIGIVRVRVPNQIISTTFGGVIGGSSLETSAAAEALFGPQGVSGVLPFGLPSSIGDADYVCLSSGPKGNAEPPCNGADAGNFGTLKGRQFGNPTIPTTTNCNASPPGDTLAMNIAVGLDHWVTLDDDADPANEVRDQCFNLGVDTLNTDTGFPNNGAEEGLATGPVDGGNLTPRLQQGSFAKTNRFGNQLDNTPLWHFLVSPSVEGGTYRYAGDPLIDADIDQPATCAGFDGSGYDWYGTGSSSPIDWDGDGSIDDNESWQHMQVCLEDYVNGNYSSIIFTTDGPVQTSGLEDSPRFGYVPQFWEDDFGNGNSWLHVLRFKAVWLQATWWKKGNTFKVFNPGEPCSSCAQSSYSMRQLSAFVIPDAALPAPLRGDPPPGTATVSPYRVELYK